MGTQELSALRSSEAGSKAWTNPELTCWLASSDSLLQGAKPANSYTQLGPTVLLVERGKGKTTLAFTSERIRFLLLEEQSQMGFLETAVGVCPGAGAGVGMASLSQLRFRACLCMRTGVCEKSSDLSLLLHSCTYRRGPRAGGALLLTPCRGGLKPRLPDQEISWVTLFRSSWPYHLTRISALSHPVP